MELLGTDCTTSFRCSLSCVRIFVLKIVVFPELSRPRIRILISFLLASRENNFENTKPMIIFNSLYRMKPNGPQSRGTTLTIQDRSRDKPQYQTKVSDQTAPKIPKTTSVIEANKAPRPSSGIKSSQNIPITKKESLDRPTPPLPPKSKLKEEDLMTQSNLNQARNGLQLLKKKMSQRGMSRDRLPEQETVIQPEEPRPRNSQIPLAKKYTPSRDQQQEEPTSQKVIRKPPSLSNTKPASKISPPPPPPMQEYINPNEEIQIKPKNVDFEKLIQMQLKAEMNGPAKPKAQRGQYREEESGENMELVQCSEGCGRSFNTTAIEKHENICRKVFQNKRKVFDSAACRKLEEQNAIPQYTAPPPKQSKPSSKISSQSNIQKPASQIPKWKLQSAAFRAGLKQATGKALTKQQAAVSEQQKQLLTQCSFCGRRFNKNAAQRHIPFCQAKSKMTSTKTMNFKKKK